MAKYRSILPPEPSVAAILSDELKPLLVVGIPITMIWLVVVLT